MLVEHLLTTDDYRAKPAQRYLKRTFPGGSDNLTFEDMVGPLEIAESEEYWYHFAGRVQDGDRRSLVTNTRVLDSLDTWLCLALDPPSTPKFPRGHDLTAMERYQNFYLPASDAGLLYARLIWYLQRSGDFPRTAFVSLNYDVLLDRVLLTVDPRGPNYEVDSFEGAENLEGPPLAKLHGSLNWRVCTSCHVLRNFKTRVIWPGGKCVDCSADLARPMLIRPTFLKDFRHRVWRDLWRRAGHRLASARRWTIIGYSLPFADVWVLRLLAQSARSFELRLEDREIEIVNPDKTAGQRFKLLFPQAIIHNMTFGHWLAARPG